MNDHKDAWPPMPRPIPPPPHPPPRPDDDARDEPARRRQVANRLHQLRVRLAVLQPAELTRDDLADIDIALLLAEATILIAEVDRLVGRVD